MCLCNNVPPFASAFAPTGGLQPDKIIITKTYKKLSLSFIAISSSQRKQN